MAAWTKILYTGDPATDLTGTAYQLLYIDSAGDVQELAHGTATHVLTSNGAAADPTWQAAAAGAHALGAGQSDVTITDVANNEVLAYDSGGDWINQTAAEAGLATTAHKDTHDPSGSDPLDTGAAGNIAPDDTAAEGSAETFARSDHTHGITCATPSSVGTAAAEGSGTNFVREDHIHDLGADCVDSGDLIADNVIGNEHLGDDCVKAAEIDAAATDITLNQVILTPKADGTGTTEGTIFYDSDDNHLYCYVV